jgi:ribosomal protein S18 acetylase RimI-like enzyme
MQPPNNAETMKLEIVEKKPAYLQEYGRIPMSFTIVSQLVPTPLGTSGLGGIELVEEALESPYEKDYDADGGPERWRRWDLENWGIFAAVADEKRVGGAVVAYRTEEINLLKGRDDLAALWDLRIDPAWQRRGIGRALFRYVEHWARARDCALLEIETQNNNVAACRFYAAQGCQLGKIDRFAYEDLPDETQLVWYKKIC